MNRGKKLQILLGIPAILLLFVFLILPLTGMVEMSFRTSGSNAPYGDGFTTAHYSRVLGDSFFMTTLLRSLVTAAIVTVLCLIVSYPLAWHLSKARGGKALLLYACIASPLMTGVLVRNFGWMIVTAIDGPLNASLIGLGLISRPLRLLFTQGLVIMALVHVFVPFMVLPINNALRNINPALSEASLSLGAGRVSTFLRIILPLSFPGIQPGVILVFVLSVAAYVTPALLGGQMVNLMPTLIIRELTGTFAWPFGSTLAIVMSVATLAIVICFSLLTAKLMERVRA
jgi:ABC-type spermidine/putrescine transport system permease subunit I